MKASQATPTAASPFLTQGRPQDTDEIFPLHTTAWNGTIKSC